MNRGDGEDIREAVGAHRSGRLRDAEAKYRAILARRPQDSDAMHFLGLALHQMGRDEEAWGFIERSIALSPSEPRNHLNAARVLSAMGRSPEAIESYQRAIALRPDHPEAHARLGDLLLAKKQIGPAIGYYRRSLEMRPDNPQTWHHVGIAHKSAGDFPEAIRCYRIALELKPDFAEALNDLGVRLQESGDAEEAILCYRRALEIEPGLVDAINNLGVLLRASGEPFQAVSKFRQALALKPGDPEIMLNLAGGLHDAGELDEAIALAQSVLLLRPQWEEVKFNLGLSLLARGDYLAGWADCQRRWEARAGRAEYANISNWDGSAPNARTMLLHCDQGFGDAIQFIRYAPRVAAGGGRVLLRCQPALRRLFSRMSGIDAVVGDDEPPPPCDVHCSLISLPRIFQTTPDDIPRNVAYLSADPVISDRWKGRLSQEPAGLKVGLAWAGSPEFRDDKLRSPHLQALEALAQAPRVRFYSLQKGYAAREAQTPPAGMTLIDWTADLDDFADTAGLIDNLDLVISSDTAVVHLAGAMGKPVWVLLPFTPGCFWLSKRATSPWYPTMRLFRQTRPRSWEEPLTQIVAALRKYEVDA